MLNKEGQRELVYLVLVDGIEELPGYDRVESAIIGGWRCIVPKGQFKVGAPGIYFEIDSKVPADNPAFAFLEKRNYKIKTQKMCKSISQGLLMHPSDFGWDWHFERMFNDAFQPVIIDDKKNEHRLNDESRFLTKELGVTYADAEDNQRKAPSVDKYKKMSQRHPEIFRQNWARWMMKRDWGKKLMFFFFGKKKDKKNGWPAWVQKTDEERIENCTFYLKDKEKQWIATEKIDGTSTSFTMKRGKRGKKEMYVCSRNVCFDSIEKPCYYETNVYWEMAQKYDVFNVLSHIIDELGCDWVTIQGETYGEGIQRNTYDLDHHDFRAFNLITSDKGRWNTIDMEEYLTPLGIFSVPILNEGMVLPDTVEELREFVNGEPSVINKKMKEGIVFRTKDGVQSFKCVSPEYLLKFHS